MSGNSATILATEEQLRRIYSQPISLRPGSFEQRQVARLQPSILLGFVGTALPTATL